MDVDQMMKRGASFADRKHATLKGHVLKFNKKATASDALKYEGKGNVEGDPTGSSDVEGTLYTITSEGLRELDRNEGYPRNYDRKEMEAWLDDGTYVKAWVYIARRDMVEEGLKPRKEYLEHYLKGKDLLSPQYYEILSRWETVD